MKFGSHNSLSYRKPVWYQRLIHFCGKCQSVNYKEQYEKYGVRLFDLRIWFNNNYNFEIRHGIIKFNISENEIYEVLSYLNKKEDCYVRIIFEETKLNRNQIDIEYKEHLFTGWRQYVQQIYTKIKFFGGNRKFDWKRLYKFKNEDEQLIDLYSSTTTLFKSDNKFLRIIDDLCPILYAKLMNKKHYQQYKDENNKWLFIDFVDIK